MRALKGLGWTLVSLGLLIFGFLGYQLGVTTLVTARAQEQLESQLAERIREVEARPVVEPTEPPATPPPTEPVPEIEELPPLYEEEAPGSGEALGRIIAPTVGLEAVLVEGVGTEDLKKGPGHMPWTPLPGQPGNSVVSGHRTTYGAPFYDLDALAVGDEILVETTVGTHTYVVRELLIVAPTDVWVTDPRPGAWLTLTTCHPRFSAAQRLVVVAELAEGPNAPYVQALLERRQRELLDAAS